MKALLPLLLFLITCGVQGEEKPLKERVSIALQKLTSGSFDERKEGESSLIKAGKKNAREVVQLILLNSEESGDPELQMRIPEVLKEIFRLDVLTVTEAPLGVSWRWYVEAKKDQSIRSWPMVDLLEKDGQLAKADVRKHDIVRSLNGKSLSSLDGVEECQRLFGLIEEGEEVVLIVTSSKMGKKHLVELGKNRTIKFKTGARKSGVRQERAGEYEKWLAGIKENLSKE